MGNPIPSGNCSDTAEVEFGGALRPLIDVHETDKKDNDVFGLDVEVEQPARDGPGDGFVDPEAQFESGADGEAAFRGRSLPYPAVHLRLILEIEDDIRAA